MMNGTPVIVMIVVTLLLILLQRRGNASPDAVRAALAKGGRIVDVRTPREFQAGHLPGAVNLPLAELAERIISEIPDKRTPILLHCASGARSAGGRHVVTKLGYETALNLGAYGRAAKLTQANP